MTLSRVGYTPNFAAGLRFITSATFSGASSVSIDGCFDAKHQHYLIMKNLSASGVEPGMSVRLRVGGADDAGSNYRQQDLYADSTSVTAARYTARSDWLSLLGFGQSTVYGFSSAWISNPFESVRTTAWKNCGATFSGNIALQNGVFEHDLATSYTGFTVLPTGGTTITGSIYVYGLREAQ